MGHQFIALVWLERGELERLSRFALEDDPVSLNFVPSPTGPGVSFSVFVIPLTRPGNPSTSVKTANTSAAGAA